MILYGAIVALGCAAGFVFAGIAYPVWVTPEIKLKAVALTAGVLLVTVALLCAVLMARLKRMDIQKLLSEEG